MLCISRLSSSTLFHKYCAGGSDSGTESIGGGEERESDGTYNRQGDWLHGSRDGGAGIRGCLQPQPLSGDDITSILCVISFKLINQFPCLNVAFLTVQVGLPWFTFKYIVSQILCRCFTQRDRVK